MWGWNHGDQRHCGLQHGAKWRVHSPEPVYTRSSPGHHQSTPRPKSTPHLHCLYLYSASANTTLTFSGRFMSLQSKAICSSAVMLPHEFKCGPLCCWHGLYLASHLALWLLSKPVCKCEYGCLSLCMPQLIKSGKLFPFRCFQEILPVDAGLGCRHACEAESQGDWWLTATGSNCLWLCSLASYVTPLTTLVQLSGHQWRFMVVVVIYIGYKWGFKQD